MIVKFCFENEIHRCSEPPASFQDLPSFLSNMFRTALPSNFDLFYVTAEKENIALTSDQDYQKLREMNSQKPIKIVIIEKPEPKEPESQAPVQENQPRLDASCYEIIRQQSEPEQVIIPESKEEEQPLLQAPAQVAIPAAQEEQQPLLKDPQQFEEVNKGSAPLPEQGLKAEYPELVEKISEDFTKIHVMPRLEELQSDPSTQEHVRKIVRETLREQVPYIIAQVKDSLIREGLINVPRDNGFAYGQNQAVRAQQHNWNSMGHQPYHNYQNQAQYQPQYQPQHQNVVYRPVPQAEDPNQNQDFFGKVAKVISDLPGKAVEMVDNIAQKIEGDPYVMVAEGRYTKNTVDKVEQLREIFPEENRKKLLDFVQQLPKNLSLDQIVDAYVSRSEEAQ